MENEYVRSIVSPDGERITYMSGPVLFVCDDGTRIRADSVVEYSADRFRQLIGNVEIDGPDTRLVASRVHSSEETGRTQAWDGVEVLEKGADTRMVGDSLVLLEAGEFRDRSELRMRGEQPYAVLRLQGEEADTATPAPPDTAVGPEGAPDDADPEGARPPQPDTVFGDRLYMEGEALFRAGGAVRIRRTDMEAFGDSLDYDRDLGRALLVGRDAEPARILSEEYDLSGRELNLRIREGRVDEVRARGGSRLEGSDVQVRASSIDIFLLEGAVERLVALRDPDRGETGSAEEPDPSPRPEAVAEDFVLLADSIEVSAPGGRLERVFAAGRARGESLGRDSLNTEETPEVIGRDWIEGDTVVATFRGAADGDDAVAAADPPAITTEGSRGDDRLERLVAVGNARTLYRMAQRTATQDEPGDTAAVGDPPDGANGAAGPPDTGGSEAGDSGAVDEQARRPGVHYVVGDRITILLDEGEVTRMEVEGQTRGLYLEPRAARPVPGGAS